MCEKIKRYELVEIVIPANATGKINFPSVPMLRNQSDQEIIIKGIETFLVTAYAKSQINQSVVGMAATELPKIVLALYVNGEENIHYIPLARLNNIRDAASNPYSEELAMFDNLSNVDLDKSYVQFNSAASATTYVIPFGFTYLKNVKSPTNPGQWIQA